MSYKLKIFLLIVPVLLLGGGCAPFNQPDLANVSREVKPIKNKLDLSKQGLTKVPEYVFGQTNLEELDLSGNRLTGAIQAEIRKLKNLKILKAGGNLMTGVPAEIGQLQNLEVLDLSDNRLTGLPYELGNLQNLKILNISGNNYSKIDLDIIAKKLPAGASIVK